jgi:xanthine dehydrogenase accessory factor
MSRSPSVSRRAATKELQAIVHALIAPNAKPSILATLVAVEGSSYRRPGARLLVSADGTRIGSISGGCLEEDLLARARQVASKGAPEVVVYDTTSENDLVWGVGLGCHGIVRILIEAIPPRPSWATVLAEHFMARRDTYLAVTYQASADTRLETTVIDANERSRAGVFIEAVAPPTPLTIFGAGDDAQPLVRLAKELGWLVTVADPRPAFATAERFPLADSIVVGPPVELVERARLNSDSVAVVMTHHYIHDVPLLRALLPNPVAYLGLLGPKKRAAKILADLAADGFNPPPAQRTQLHAPVGLDLGADAPEQVALAIVAEIQTTLTGRTARPLRERTQPIHEVFAAAKT